MKKEISLAEQVEGLSNERKDREIRELWEKRIELDTENRLLKQILEQLLKIELIPRLSFNGDL